MAIEAYDLNEIKRRMTGAVASLKHELNGLRTGRASSSLLDPIMVDAYGSKMPLNQVATVTVPEARTISVQVWDRGMINAVDKAIRESTLGLNPIGEGQILRIPIPELNTERRKELVKVAHKYTEAARVAVRHVRRDGMDLIKKQEKNNMSEDDMKRHSEQLQKAVDASIDEIDKLLVQKEQEIMSV